MRLYILAMGDFSYLKKTLARNLRTFRQAKKITQDQLEELSGISRYTISDIENCLTWPKDETLEKLAASLGIKPTDFFNDSSNPGKDISVREEVFNQVKSTIKATLNNAIDDLTITYNTTHSKRG